MRKATLFVLVLLAANVMAQTTNITSLATVAVATLTAPDGSPGIFEVARYSPDCSATGCTEMLYSFCLDQIPGCREGFGSVPQSSFAGTVTTNYLRHDKLTFQYEAVASDSTFFTNFVCNAFDQYGDCLDETEVPGDAGAAPAQDLSLGRSEQQR